MEQKAKYLRVTIHDNDFSYSLQMIGNLLYHIFQYTGNYPTKDDFPVLKENIKHMWFGTNSITYLMYWKEMSNVGIDYFEPDLEFVDYLDFADCWDNGESIYIPMFDNSVILRR